MFIGLTHFFYQSGPAVYFRPINGLKYANVNKRLLPINALQSASLATNSHLFTSRFPYFLETLSLYFDKYRHTSVLPADFRTNTVKYGQVGRSATEPDLQSQTHSQIHRIRPTKPGLHSQTHRAKAKEPDLQS